MSFTAASHQGAPSLGALMSSSRTGGGGRVATASHS